ncbi:MAG: PqqD family protein [Planctomycetes bacterium]|nr:PqqD family protein [Planctomycetota bacterium]
MLAEQKRLRLAEDMTFQPLGADGQAVVVSLASGQLYTCNETTRAFLQAIDGKRSFGEIVDMLADEYAVARGKLMADLATIAARLIEEKLIAVAEGRIANQ